MPLLMLVLLAFGFGFGFGYVILGDLGGFVLGTALAGIVVYLFLRGQNQT